MVAKAHNGTEQRVALIPDAAVRLVQKGFVEYQHSGVVRQIGWFDSADFPLHYILSQRSFLPMDVNSKVPRAL
jgi:hypothetical protein